MGYSSIIWLPITAVLTGIGLVASYYAGQRRGNRAMLRGAAWSLIPIAAYLTGSIEMFWKIGDAIGNFATAFVFSPERWAGVAVAGGAAVLFLATGGRQRRKASRLKAAQRAEQKKAAAAAAPDGVAASGSSAALPAALPTSNMPVATKPVPVKAAQSKGKGRGAPVDDDMKDIEDILRNRGI